jgi:hypothetical protein
MCVRACVCVCGGGGCWPRKGLVVEVAARFVFLGLELPSCINVW